uniref:PNPLA domain-containing protein n=1 Tax=Alexandrium monilatum TaxID=311494 RepID=A0A7S4QNP9_9DINO
MAASQVFASAVQAGLWYTFHVLTVGWHVVQRFASRVLPAKDRAPQRLPPPRWLSAPGSGSVRWTYSGASSGAFVAAPFAMGINCADVLLNAHRRFVKERERVGGCIGVYSCNVRGILHDEIEAARSAGLDPLQAADGRLAVSVTSLSPHPTHTVVTEFRSDQALLDAVLASCYIPVAYEQPIVLDGLGFCIDGCVSAFLPNTRCVVSPYHCHLADVTPTEEYEGTLVFNLLHGDDVLRLFEVRSPRGVRPSWRCCSRDSASS